MDGATLLSGALTVFLMALGQLPWEAPAIVSPPPRPATVLQETGGYLLRAGQTPPDSDILNLELGAESWPDLLPPDSPAPPNHRFLVVRLTPEAQYFTAQDEALRAVQRLESAAAYASATGCHGIALDTDGIQAFYSYDWAGYDWSVKPPDRLTRQATAFGRSLGLAFRRRFADGDLLVTGLDSQAAGPLWFPMARGLMAGAAENGAFPYMAAPLPEDAVGPRQAALEAQWLHERLVSGLSAPLRSKWQRDPRTALTLPVHDGTFDDRLRLLAARLYATHYVLATEPPGTFLESLLPELDAYTRVGAAQFEGEPAYCLSGVEGVAFVLWYGLGEKHTIYPAATTVRQVMLATGEESFHRPEDNAADIGPFAGPALIDRLPASTWALPNSLWARADAVAPATEFEVQYGLNNRTLVTMEGLLTAGGDPGVAVSPNRIEYDLRPNDNLQVAAAARGDFQPGDAVPLTLQAFGPEGPLAKSTHVFRCFPALAGHAPVTGSVSGLTASAHGEQHVYGTTQAGVAFCIDPHGTTVWGVQQKEILAGPPVCVTQDEAEPVLVAVDIRGFVRALSAEGDERWCIRAFEGSPVGLLELDNSTALAAGTPGQIRAIDSSGDVRWQAFVPDGVRHVVAEDVHGGPGKEVFCLSDTEVTVLWGEGQPLWRSPVEVVPSCVPLLGDVDQDGQAELLVGGSQGELVLKSAAFGWTHRTTRLLGGGPIIALATASRGDLDRRFFAIGQHAVTALDTSLNVLWRREMPCAGKPAVSGDVFYVPLRNGGLAKLGSDGEIEWVAQHTRAPITAGPIIVPGGSAGNALLVYGDADGQLFLLPLV